MKQFDIVIIGSGFAAYQLVKSIRRLDSKTTIAIVTADEGHEYNKPDLSHVFSKQQTAMDVVTKTADQFANDNQVALFSNVWVEKIDNKQQTVSFGSECLGYARLVLATGASPFVPVIKGDSASEVLTHNSLVDYQRSQQRLSKAQKLLVVGGGLIGVEIALDLAIAGKQVTLIEPAKRLMQNQLPELIEFKLRSALYLESVTVVTQATLLELNHIDGLKQAKLSNSQVLEVDEVVLCAGLRSNTTLASQLGLQVNKGIVVDAYQATSEPNIYALGDCAEFKGEVRAYLQPIVLGAVALAKTLISTPTQLQLPAMLTKVKTPSYPIQLAGSLSAQKVSRWSYEVDDRGIVAKAFDTNNNLIGFATTQQRVSDSFPLLREL